MLKWILACSERCNGETPRQEIHGNKKGGKFGNTAVVNNPSAMASMTNITNPCVLVEIVSMLLHFTIS